MAVPTDIADLSTTASSNSPAGTDAIGTSLDDYLRAIQAIVKQNASIGSNIASSGTIAIPDAGSYFIVTGTTTISTISDSWDGRLVVLKFSGALTLTHSSGLILPASENYTTAAGDVVALVNESTGVWRSVVIQAADGLVDASKVTYTPDGTSAVEAKVQQKLREHPSIYDFLSTAQIADAQAYGATLDMTAAIQAAAVFAVANSKFIYFPPGAYPYDTDSGTLTLRECGFTADPMFDKSTAAPSGVIDHGAVFWITGSTNRFCNMERGSRMDGLGFYYPDQTTDQGVAVITAYPATLYLKGATDGFTNSISGVHIENCTAYNPYDFVAMEDVSGVAGGCFFTSNRIYAINIAFTIENHADFFFWRDNITSVGIWGKAGSKTDTDSLAYYTRLNGENLKHAGGDGIYYVNNVCVGYNRGIHFHGDNTSANFNLDGGAFECLTSIYITGDGAIPIGSVTGTKFIGLEGDIAGVSSYALYYDADTTNNTRETRLAFSGCKFREQHDNDFYIAGNKRIVVTINGGQFYESVGGSILLNNALAVVNVNGATFEEFTNSNIFEITAGDSLLVIGNTFIDITGSNYIYDYNAGAALGRLVIVGNAYENVTNRSNGESNLTATDITILDDNLLGVGQFPTNTMDIDGENGTVTNIHKSSNGEHNQFGFQNNADNAIQIGGTNAGGVGTAILLTNAEGAADNRHWAVQHRGTTDSNRFKIYYNTSTSDGGTNLLGTGTEMFSIDKDTNLVGSTQGGFSLKDSMVAPTNTAGLAHLYVDSVTGLLTVKYADGTTKTLATV